MPPLGLLIAVTPLIRKEFALIYFLAVLEARVLVVEEQGRYADAHHAVAARTNLTYSGCS